MKWQKDKFIYEFAVHSILSCPRHYRFSIFTTLLIKSFSHIFLIELFVHEHDLVQNKQNSIKNAFYAIFTKFYILWWVVLEKTQVKESDGFHHVSEFVLCGCKMMGWGRNVTSRCSKPETWHHAYATNTQQNTMKMMTTKYRSKNLAKRGKQLDVNS